MALCRQASTGTISSSRNTSTHAQHSVRNHSLQCSMRGRTRFYVSSSLKMSRLSSLAASRTASFRCWAQPTGGQYRSTSGVSGLTREIEPRNANLDVDFSQSRSRNHFRSRDRLDFLQGEAGRDFEDSKSVAGRLEETK